MSNLSAFPYIPERAEAVPALWNNIFSILSANDAALNSAATISFPSGNTLSVFSSIDASGNLHAGNRIGVGPVPSADTVEVMTIGADSSKSDYILFHDPTGARSSYVIGSRVGGTADGLNIYDASGNTMLASFSKQSIRFYQNVVGPVFDTGGALADTYNAATFIGSGSTLSAIQAAINQASIDHVSRVYLPASMYPYSASSISFVHTVRMVREGGNWSVFDVLAYGANGLNVISDSSAFGGALSAASTVDGTVFVPSPTSGYKITALLDIPRFVSVIGENKHATRLVHSFSTTMVQLAFGATLANLWLDGNGSNFSGPGIAIYNGEGKQTVRSCSIIDFSDYCVHFRHEQAGSESLWEDLEIRQVVGNTVGQEAVKVSGSLTVGAVPRTWIGIQTENHRFADFGPCNNFLVAASRIGDCSWQTTSIGIAIVGSRIAGFESIMTVQGAGISVVGCDIAPRVLIASGVQATIFRGNTYNLPGFIDQAFSGTNVLEDQKSTVSFPFAVFSDGSTIPDISQSNVFRCANTSGTTITNFANGYDGQQILVRLDLLTGLQYNSGSIRLDAFQDIPIGTVGANDMIEFTRISGIWFECSRSWGQPIARQFGANALLPEWAVNSEVSLGWYRSGTSRIGLSYGQAQFPVGSTTTPSIALSVTSLGFYRSANSGIGLTGGAFFLPNGSNTTPTLGYSSNSSLGFYSSGAQTIAQSLGTFNLATNNVRLSMRTIAASALTASAANTNVAVNEVVFTIQASGASFAINSGGTTWLFNSDASAKNT